MKTVAQLLHLMAAQCSEKYKADGHVDMHSAIPSCPLYLPSNCQLPSLCPMGCWYVVAWLTNQQRSQELGTDLNS